MAAAFSGLTAGAFRHVSAITNKPQLSAEESCGLLRFCNEKLFF